MRVFGVVFVIGGVEDAYGIVVECFFSSQQRLMQLASLSLTLAPPTQSVLVRHAREGAGLPKGNSSAPTRFKVPQSRTPTSYISTPLFFGRLQRVHVRHDRAGPRRL